MFRQLAADVASRFHDEGIRESLERAAAIGGLDLKAMDDPSLAAKLTSALRDVAQDTANGVLVGWRPEDRAGAQMYREAMAEVVAAVDKN